MATAVGRNINMPPITEARISTQLILFSVIGMSVNIMPIFLASFPIMLPAMEKEFGANRSALTLGYAMLATALALFAPVFGRLLDKWGPVKLLFPAVIAFGAGLALFLVIPANLPAYFALCILIGFAGAASYQFVYYSVLPHWFDRRLGLAFGFAGAGAALGLGLVPSYATYLLSHFSWRETYAILGLTSMAIALPNLLLLYGTHQKTPGSAKASKSPDGEEAGQTLREAISHPVFWRMAASYFLICLLINGHIIHLVPMMIERGVDTSSAAAAMAALGVSMLISRLACGFMLDYIRPAPLGAVIFLIGTSGAIVVAMSTSLPVMMLGIGLIGVALGVENELINYMARAVFGLRAYGATLGALSTAFLLGVILGPLVMSVTHDMTGSYAAGRIVLIVAGLAAGVLHFGIPTPFMSSKAQH